MYSKVIVTGATGWLGKRLAATLRAHYPSAEIRCLVEKDQDTHSLQALHCRVLEGDLRNPASLAPLFEQGEGALLVHCAGLIHPRLLVKSFYDINLKGTQNLFASALAAGIQRLVAISSNSPLGTNPDVDHVFDENSPYHPYMHYGKSKWKMELFLKEKMHQMPEITIIRTPWFYGPGQPLRQTTFFKMIKEGKFPILGDGSNKRSMSYVDNLVEGILLASESSLAINEIFWIADERPYTMLEIVTTIQDLLKKDFALKVVEKIPHFPQVIGDIAQAFDWSLQTCGFYHQKIHVLSEMNKTIACRIDKAQKILGYQPNISLREGMRCSIEWCLANGGDI